MLPKIVTQEFGFLFLDPWEYFGYFFGLLQVFYRNLIVSLNKANKLFESNTRENKIIL